MNEHRLLSEREWGNFSQALGFLWRVRTQLHYFYGRREDRLSFEDQEAVAQALGYRGADSLQATESFLKGYFHQALQVHQLSWNLLEKCLENPWKSQKNFSREVMEVNDIAEKIFVRIDQKIKTLKAVEAKVDEKIATLDGLIIRFTKMNNLVESARITEPIDTGAREIRPQRRVLLPERGQHGR